MKKLLSLLLALVLLMTTAAPMAFAENDETETVSEPQEMVVLAEPEAQEPAAAEEPAAEPESAAVEPVPAAADAPAEETAAETPAAEPAEEAQPVETEPAQAAEETRPAEEADPEASEVPAAENAEPAPAESAEEVQQVTEGQEDEPAVPVDEPADMPAGTDEPDEEPAAEETTELEEEAEAIHYIRLASGTVLYEDQYLRTAAESLAESALLPVVNATDDEKAVQVLTWDGEKTARYWAAASDDTLLPEAKAILELDKAACKKVDDWLVMQVSFVAKTATEEPAAEEPVAEEPAVEDPADTAEEAVPAAPAVEEAAEPVTGNQPEEASATRENVNKASSLTVNPRDTNAVILRWTAVNGATAYNIYRSTSANGTYTKIKSNITGTTTNNYSLTPGATYYYRIRPVKNGAEIGVYSNTASISIMPNITTISAVGRDATTVSISWNAVRGATGYQLFRKLEGSGDFEWVKNVTASQATNTGLTTGKTYWFKVRAYIDLADGTRAYGSFSAGVNATPRKPVSNQAPVLSVQPRDTNAALLKWSAVPDADSYNIYRWTSDSSANPVRIKSNIKGTTTNNYSLTPGTTYYYRVVPVFTGVEGKASNAAKLAVMATMGSVKGIRSQQNVMLSWGSIAGATGYEIFYKKEGVGDFVWLKTVKGATTATISGLPGDVVYWFKVRAIIDLADGTRAYGSFSGGVSVSLVDPVYRALLVGQSYYLVQSYLPGPANDVAAMKNALSNLGNKFRVTTLTNATSDEIISSIKSTFSGTRDTDVSLFFYSGHGHDTYDSYAGALCGYYDGFYDDSVTPAELASALNTYVKGKVIVLLDSCGSGSAIYARSANADTIEHSPDAFNQAIINALAGYTVTYDTMDAEGKTGELRESKFVVITASAHGQVSLDVSDTSGNRGGLFTRAVVAGMGCSFPGGVYTGNMPCDSNKDKKLTLNELASYCRTQCSAAQDVQSYGTGSYVLFYR